MSLLPHQAVSSPSNHDHVETPSNHLHGDPIRIVENNNDDDSAEATFTSIIPAPSSLVSSSSHHHHHQRHQGPSASSEDENHNKDDDDEISIEMDLRCERNASGNINSSPSTNNAQQQNAPAASSGSTPSSSSTSTSSGTRRSNNYNASNGTNSDDLSQTIRGSSTNFQPDGEDGGTSRRTSTASTTVLYGGGGTSTSVFFNPRQIFALQNPNLALTAPSRRTVLFVFMMTLSSILYICGTFQPLVVADSSYQAARYFDITPRLNAPPTDASSTTKDEGYTVTQWLQCYSNFSKRVLTSTSFRIDTERICDDPTSDDSAIFCGKAKRLFHASRGFQAFAMISTLLGSILALCSFCGSRRIARYSNRINFTLALLSCLFGLLAIVLATRIVVGSSATCEDRPISMASATIFIEEDSNNDNNNTTSQSDEKIFSGGAFLPLTAIAFGLNVVCVVLCLLAGTECLEMKFSVSSCCCCTSSNENNIDDEQRERRRGTGARRNF